MTGCCGCGIQRRAGWRRRAVDAAGLAAPAAVLALIPKCPMCVAAYVAIGTGIGISAAAASYVRTGLIGLCVVSFAWVAFRFVRRTAHRGHARGEQ